MTAFVDNAVMSSRFFQSLFPDFRMVFSVTLHIKTAGFLPPFDKLRMTIRGVWFVDKSKGSCYFLSITGNASCSFLRFYTWLRTSGNFWNLRFIPDSCGCLRGNVFNILTIMQLLLCSKKCTGSRGDIHIFIVETRPISALIFYFRRGVEGGDLAWKGSWH
jgi:hypothetical protein